MKKKRRQTRKINENISFHKNINDDKLLFKSIKVKERKMKK